MDSGIKKIVLAYSGGLDTSVILHWLKGEYPGAEIIAVSGDVGQGSELSGLEDRAKAAGASKLYIEDLKKEFVEEYIFPTLKAGAVYEGEYLLGTAFARPVIAKRIAKIALAEGADAICHGCTGKGNDQVRFELTIKAFAPHMKIIAPWRIWNIRSRDDALDYAEKHGIRLNITREKSYSKDKNLWHLSHEGLELENPANEPDYKEGFLEMGLTPEQAPDMPEYVELGFEKGVPVSVNGEMMGGVELIETLNAIGGRNGVGIADIVENRLVGMKSRGIYETPGGAVLYKAHRILESVCLDRDTAHYKELVAARFAELVYFGQWFTPLRRAISAFVDETQGSVTGTVKLKLYKGNIISAGVSSPYSLYSEEIATFGQDEVYDQKDSQGFVNLFGLPVKVGALAREKLEQGG